AAETRQILLTMADRLDRAAEVIEGLVRAIVCHRDPRGDDRCWLDDIALYSTLPDTILVDQSLPPRVEFLASCERYWRQRQPDGACAAGRTIAQLEAENATLRGALRSIQRAEIE